MFRKMIPLAVAIVVVLGCKKKDESGGGGGDGGDPNATYTLKFRDPQQGEKYEVTIVETSDLDLDGKGDKLSQQKKYEYTEHILEMPAGEKRPTKLTRTYKTAQRSGLEGKQMKAQPFEGKTVTIEKKPGGYEFSVDGKKLSGFEAFELEGEFRKDDSKESEALLPKQPVKVGDTWTVDPEAVKSMMGPGAGADLSKSKLNCKLAKAYTKDGKQWGVIEFDFDIVVEAKGKGPDSGSGSVKITGSIDAVVDGSARDGTMKGSVQGTFSASEKGKEMKGTIGGTNEKTVKTVK